jgi:tetratricopeptide (TPR) repeat protein
VGRNVSHTGMRYLLLVLVTSTILTTSLFASPSVNAYSKADALWNRLVSEYQASANSNELLPNLLLGISYANLGKLTKGLDYLSTFGKLSETRGKLQVRELLAAYKNELQVNNNDLLNLNVLAFGFAFGMNDYEESARYLETIVRLDPDNIYARDYLGLVLGYCNKVDEAISTLKEALVKFPNHEYTHFLLALAYRQKGQLGMMMSELSKSGSVLAEMAAYQLSRKDR